MLNLEEGVWEGTVYLHGIKLSPSNYLLIPQGKVATIQ